MAINVARLQAVLSADTKQFELAMARSEAQMGKVTKAARVAGLGIMAGLGVVAAVGFKELQRGAEATAQTNAVLKSTGGIANVTTKHVQNLASALMHKSGIDDEAIQSGENLLLTFRNIRNETGRGNKMFDAATKAALDLSIAFHKDLNASAILVGKALNDPIKGLTALQRIGVQFTEQQREQVKALIGSAAAVKTASKAVTAAQAAYKSAIDKVTGAQDALDSANRSVIDSLRGVTTATHGVTTAKLALTNAQKQAKDAQKSLTEARKAATRQLQDMRDAVKDTALSERSAALALERAQEHLNEVMNDSESTQLDYEEALLGVDQAQQNLTESHKTHKRAVNDLTEANKKGVKGSDQVKAALDAIVSSNQAVRDAMQGVKDAIQNVADSQQAVADAQKNAVQAQQDLAVAQSDAAVAGKKLSDSQKVLRAEQDKIKNPELAHANRLKAQKIILGEINKQVAGSAEAYGKTLPGRLGIAQESFQNVAATITTILMPALSDMVDSLSTGTTFLEHHKTISKAAATALFGLGVALVVATTAQWAFNAAAEANPYVLIATALIATTLLVIKFRKQIWQFIVDLKTIPAAIKTFFMPTWNGMVAAMQFVYNWLKNHWPEIATIISGPFAPLVALATNAFGIRSALVGAFGKIQEAARGLWEWFKKLVQPLDKILDAFKWIIKHAKEVSKWIGKIPGLGGDGTAEAATGPKSPQAPRGSLARSGSSQGKAFNVGSQLWDEIGMGIKDGLVVLAAIGQAQSPRTGRDRTTPTILLAPSI